MSFNSDFGEARPMSIDKADSKTTILDKLGAAVI